jgi:hypothetical protein
MGTPYDSRSLANVSSSPELKGSIEFINTVHIERTLPTVRIASQVGAMNWQSWQNLFQRLSLCSAGGLNAVCNSAGAVDEASDRKLRFAIHIQATQVYRLCWQRKRRLPSGHRPRRCGDCRTQKHCFAAEEFNAIAAVATDGTARECQGPPAINANTVVVKLGIE